MTDTENILLYTITKDFIYNNNNDEYDSEEEY